MPCSVLSSKARMILLLAVLWGTAPASAQSVAVEVLEPLEGSKAVFQGIAPPAAHAAKQGRLSLRLRIRNTGSKTVRISRIEVLGREVSDFASPVEIQAGSSFVFQNCNCSGSKPLVFSPRSLTRAKISIYLENAAAPVEATVAIAPHTNDNGPLLFPGKVNDLRTNEAWGASSNHGSDHQVFALDMGVLGWNQTAWAETFPGTNGSRKEHYRVYGMPVYAMADGTVCWALNDHEERPTVADSPTSSPSQGGFVGGGNQIFVKSGDEIAVYAHFQRGSIPQELLQPGAAVRKGQYLGKVGLSGSTSHPHIHIHLKKEPAMGAPTPGELMNACDAGFFRPMAFKDLQSLTQTEAATLAASGELDGGDWTPLTNHSAPHAPGLLYPSSAPHAFCRDCTDNRQYIGVWRGADEIELRVKAAGWNAFSRKWSELSSDRFRLIGLETLMEGGQRHFLGLFRRGSGRHFLWNAPGWEPFTAKWNDLSRDGLRLVDLLTYVEGGVRRFAGVFREGSDRYVLWRATGWDSFTGKWDELARDGLRLVDLETFPVGGGERQYIGIFRGGNDAYALWSAPGWDQFIAKWNELSGSGLRLVDIETFPANGQRQFIGVFRQGQEGYALESVTGHLRFVESSEKHNAAGLRLVDIHAEE